MISYTETYHPHTDGLADLALPIDLEDQLRDADADTTERVADAITAKIREHGVDTETGEWLGDWSAEETVRRILQPEYTG